MGREGNAQTESFWDRTWHAVSRARLAAYSAQLDRAADAVIDRLKAHGVRSVCDAGCGCGAYARKLALHGFAVSGFDISAEAAALTRTLLAESGCAAGEFRAADILHTPYPDGAFDAVVARSVLDHMPRADAVRAVRELLRITRPGGCVALTLDAADTDYEAAPHTVSADGDYIYTGGNRAGMVFHPYTEAELSILIPDHAFQIPETGGGFTVVIEKGGIPCCSMRSN